MKLDEYKKRHGLKLAELAELLGVSVPTISRILAGSSILTHTALRIEQATGGAVTAQELMASALEAAAAKPGKAKRRSQEKEAA